MKLVPFPCWISERPIVTSCLGIAHSYKAATVGATNKPVQNTQWCWLIQPRSIWPWLILYPTSVNESPQRLTKFICSFCTYHSVCSNIWDVSLVTTLLILMPLMGEYICELFVLFHRGENKQEAEEINPFLSFKA